MDTRIYNLKNISVIKSGKRLPAGHVFAKGKTNHAYVRARDIRNGTISSDNLVYISDFTYDKIKRYIIEKGDVAITIVANIGDVGYCEDNCHGANLTENAVRLTNIDKKIVDAKYLALLLGQPSMKNYMESLAAGAAQAKLGIYKIENIQVSIPERTYQHRIVNIISSYDNLIDINTKRIKLLEETARELYKEWFVRMRFPGHEQAKFVKGIPEGWALKELKELVSTQYGLTTTAHSEKESNDVYYLRITDIVDNYIDWSHVPYCTADDDIITKYKLFPGDLLVARTGATVGYATQIQKIPFDAVFASYLIRLKAKNKLHISYIGMSVVSDTFRDYIQSIATGAAQPMANPHLMTSFKLFLPCDSLLEKFNEKIDLINDEILTLQLQNQNLIATRDRLLPRLLSGELKVKA